MKELDLQVFEKHPDVDAYRFGPSFTPYAIVAQEKRFTDAELAAEYWSAENEASMEDATEWQVEANGYRFPVEGAKTLAELEDEAAIFKRFATLPHYDEQ